MKHIYTLRSPLGNGVRYVGVTSEDQGGGVTLIRMTYAHPEQMRSVADETGKMIRERVPGSPTRPALDYEVNVWWEEVDDRAAAFSEIMKLTGEENQEVFRRLAA